MGLLIFYAAISIFFSFLCSVLEAALLSFTPSFLQIKKKEGKKYAENLIRMKEDVDRPLIAILTVNTIAHTVGAILVGVQAEKAFGDGTNAVGVVSAIMTIAILVLSEIIPKTIGATYWKKLGGFTAKTLKLFIIPLKYTGILWLMLLTTRVIGKSTGGSTMSREEFIVIANAAEEEGVFEENETTIIKNLLKFKKVQAKDVMTPFSVATIENKKTTIQEFYDKYRDLPFSRVPVYEETPNNITGFVLKDDVLEEMIEEKGSEPLELIQREIMISSSTTPVPGLFEKFIDQKSHISIIVDEYGNTVGIVTMEDIIETLLGLEIMDESDDVEDMQVLARKNWEKRQKRKNQDQQNSSARRKS